MSYPPSMGTKEIKIDDVSLDQFAFWLYPRVKKQQGTAAPTYEAPKATVIITLQTPRPNTPTGSGYMDLPVNYTSLSVNNDTGKETHSPGIYTAYGIEAQQLGVTTPHLAITGHYSQNDTLKALFDDIWDQIARVFFAVKDTPEAKTQTIRFSYNQKPWEALPRRIDQKTVKAAMEDKPYSNIDLLLGKPMGYTKKRISILRKKYPWIPRRHGSGTKRGT